MKTAETSGEMDKGFVAEHPRKLPRPLPKFSAQEAPKYFFDGKRDIIIGAAIAITTLCYAGFTIINSAKQVMSEKPIEMRDALFQSIAANALGIAFTLGLAILAIAFLAKSKTLVTTLVAAPIIPDDETATMVLNSTPYGVSYWENDGALTCANPAFFSLLRIEAEDFPLGSTYRTVTQQITGRITAKPILDSSRQRIVEVEREDGTAIMLDERPSENGGFITIVTDITERKAADKMLSDVRFEQKQLAQRYYEEKKRAEAASRAKTAFLAHLSHDIRTPLNHIIGFADLLCLEIYGPLEDKYKTYLADIKKSGETLLSSFAEILEYAELEGGGKTLQPECVNIEILLKDSVSQYAERARNKGINLHVAELVKVDIMADLHGIHRILSNIIDNSIRHTSMGGEVRVAAWQAEDGIVLEVTDTGAGMSREQVSRLSQPFVMTDASLTKTHNGIGLGIAIARTLAELSGGQLMIDSMPDVGTTVAIALPLQAPQKSRNTKAA